MMWTNNGFIKVELAWPLCNVDREFIETRKEARRPARVLGQESR